MCAPYPAVGLMIPPLSARSAVYWNDRFSHWQRPASETEEDKIARTARMVRDVLAGFPNCTIIPKGSYQQNTNVRANSDMDIGVCQDTIVRWSDWGEIPSEGILGLVPFGETNLVAFRRFKGQLDFSLAAAFGRYGVAAGNKAIAVHANAGSRVDADVVPCFRLWNILPRSHWPSPVSPRYHEGIVLWADDGRVIINYPQQCYDNGVAKNFATLRRYKRVVRILKRLKAELPPGLMYTEPPSFLVECLVWNVPDMVFLATDDMYTIVTAVLRWIVSATAPMADVSGLFETNGIKPLFATTGVCAQPWTSLTAHFFADRALRHLGVV